MPPKKPSTVGKPVAVKKPSTVKKPMGTAAKPGVKKPSTSKPGAKPAPATAASKTVKKTEPVKPVTPEPVKPATPEPVVLRRSIKLKQLAEVVLDDNEVGSKPILLAETAGTSIAGTFLKYRSGANREPYRLNQKKLRKPMHC